MAFTTDTTIAFFGTPTVVSAGGGTAIVASAAYSAAADAAAYTNTENTVKASFVLKCQYPSGTITAGGIILACRLLNNSAAIDEPVVGSTWNGHYLGAFPTGTGMAATTDYALELGPVPLPMSKDSQEYEFYILNSCGVSLSAGWTLTIIPVTVGPHA